MPKKKKAGDAPLYVRFTFPDGTSERISLIEHQQQLLKQYAAAASSDNPKLRAKGMRLLSEAAALTADAISNRVVSTNSGQLGGKANKRRLWANELAAQLLELSPATESEAWIAVPESSGRIEIETPQADFEVYRDGDTLVAVDLATRRESSLTKTTFFKQYYRQAKLGK